LALILVIDDDPDLLRVCKVALGALGNDVKATRSGLDGLTQAALLHPDVVILDLGLPDVEGLEVCGRLRTWSQVPVIVLSADSSEDRKVDALGLGADDYVTKPFGMRELNARIQVALRHRRDEQPCAPAEIDVGALRLDLVHCEATLEGKPVGLTPKEFEFLSFLARHQGKVCTRRMILEGVWGPRYSSELNYLKVYAYRVRRKLNDEGGEILQSDPSVGYRLVAPIALQRPGGHDERPRGQS
jgi:two-component system KDP operon response regulator KdpE